jgi:hypothetical protein
VTPDDPGPRDAVPSWTERRAYWRRRLGRLMLDAEPLDEQLARYRRVTWGLTVVPLFIGLIIFGLLTAFGAPAVGAVVSAILFLPIVAVAWLDYWRLARRVARYEEERRAYEMQEARAVGE